VNNMEAFNIAAVAVIIGTVRGVILGLEQLNVKTTSLIGFLLALGVGIVLALLSLFGLTVETGIVAGLTAAGTYQIAKKVGGV